MAVNYEPVSKADVMAGKYAYVTYEDNDPAKPMAKIFRNSDGTIDEKATYSSRYLKSQQTPPSLPPTGNTKKKNDDDDMTTDTEDNEKDWFEIILMAPFIFIYKLIKWIFKAIWWVIKTVLFFWL